MTPICPKCKSDAFGRMGNWDQCLSCGYIDKSPDTKTEKGSS